MRSSKIKDFWDTKNRRFFSASTTTIARSRNALGFDENKIAAREGGEIAGDARKNLEIKSKEKIVTPNNYLEESKRAKRIEKMKQVKK